MSIGSPTIDPLEQEYQNALAMYQANRKLILDSHDLTGFPSVGEMIRLYRNEYINLFDLYNTLQTATMNRPLMVAFIGMTLPDAWIAIFDGEFHGPFYSEEEAKVSAKGATFFPPHVTICKRQQLEPTFDTIEESIVDEPIAESI